MGTGGELGRGVLKQVIAYEDDVRGRRTLERRVQNATNSTGEQRSLQGHRPLGRAAAPSLFRRSRLV